MTRRTHFHKVFETAEARELEEPFLVDEGQGVGVAVAGATRLADSRVVICREEVAEAGLLRAYPFLQLGCRKEVKGVEVIDNIRQGVGQEAPVRRD